MAEVLRAGDYRVAEVKGHVPEGERTILCVEVPRRDAQKLIRLASAVDELCASIVHDIRATDSVMREAPDARKRKSSWRLPFVGLAWFKRGVS